MAEDIDLCLISVKGWNEILERLLQMLQEHDIQHIISIDDGWDAINKEEICDYESLSKMLVKMEVDGNITVEEYCNSYAIDLTEQEQDDLNERGVVYLKDIFQLRQKNDAMIVKIIATLHNEIDQSLHNLISILEELNIKSDFKIVTSAEFKDEFTNIQGNALYILDKNMGDKKENEFLQYIISLTDKRRDFNDLVIVYSNEVNDLLTHSQKVDYLKAQDVNDNELKILYQMWPVSKITDPTCLINNITEMVSKSLYGKALYKLVQLQKESLGLACNDLLKIDINNIDDMIIESYIEGAKLTEKYQALLESLIKKSFNQLANQPDILTAKAQLLLHEKARAHQILAKKDIDGNGKYQNYRKLKNEEKLLRSNGPNNNMLFSVADYSINNTLSDPQMGDIFIYKDPKDLDKKACMLISQECKSIIRIDKYGTPPTRKAKSFLMLIFEIVEITTEELSSIGDPSAEESIWPIKYNDKVYFLKNTNKSMNVEMGIIDLCGLNISGEAAISYDKGLIKRFKNEHSTIYLDGLDDRIRTSINSVLIKILPPKPEPQGAVQADLDIRNVIVSLAYGLCYAENKFEIKRICRIDAKRSLNIIHGYLTGIGKIGMDTPPSVD